ncbi:MAG: globin domain-containing protein [Verrucomicrobiales bacterium]|nr:globin domain-containing protein [Verrucomicrobiales bacterium]
MTPQQITLVQTTWEQVVPISETAASLFYGRLFELDPELKPLFKSDIKEQGKKLMQMITLAVSGLNDLNKLVPAVEDLGRRHVRYGVRQKDYETVGAALLWTLEQGLGNTFTREVKDAWATVYAALATTMQKAADRQIISVT